MGDLERFEGRKKQTPRTVEWDHPECYIDGCSFEIDVYFLHLGSRPQCWKGWCRAHRQDGLSSVTRTVEASRWGETNLKTKRAVMTNLCER